MYPSVLASGRAAISLRELQCTDATMILLSRLERNGHSVGRLRKTYLNILYTIESNRYFDELTAEHNYVRMKTIQYIVKELDKLSDSAIQEILSRIA